jgi:hypothetical protein
MSAYSDGKVLEKALLEAPIFDEMPLFPNAMATDSQHRRLHHADLPDRSDLQLEAEKVRLLLTLSYLRTAHPWLTERMQHILAEQRRRQSGEGSGG